MNNISLQGRDITEALRYFGLRDLFTIEELERSKYLKSKEDIENLTLEEKYKLLLELRLTDLVKKNKEVSKGLLHKQEFAKQFKAKYNVNLPSFNNRDELNDKILAVSNLASSVNVDSDITNTYDSYVRLAGMAIDSYSNELNTKNKNYVPDIVNYRREQTKNPRTLLNDSLDVVMNNFYENIKSDVKDQITNNYLIFNINMAFKDVKKYFEQEQLDNILSKYRDDINTFLLTKYNSYIKNTNIEETGESKKDIVNKFLMDFQNSINAYSISLFRKILVELRLAATENKDSNLIDDEMFASIIDSLNKAENLDDLARVYNQIHLDNKIVKFAK